ncbi:hypothetical protein QUB70_01995 [Microcoleus sp. A003_D6]|uniref:hypothetical protein n=1 Tax=Microcoleus sp. A003_D6 TaxID=3055266 RepID=UPI002FD404D0
MHNSTPEASIQGKLLLYSSPDLFFILKVFLVIQRNSAIALHYPWESAALPEIFVENKKSRVSAFFFGDV